MGLLQFANLSFEVLPYRRLLPLPHLQQPAAPRDQSLFSEPDLRLASSRASALPGLLRPGQLLNALQ